MSDKKTKRNDWYRSDKKSVKRSDKFGISKKVGQEGGFEKDSFSKTSKKRKDDESGFSLDNKKTQQKIERGTDDCLHCEKTIPDGKKFDVIIVGGGYSGLVATAKLVENGIVNVLVIDGQKRVGKKILATGNGRGNVSNEVVTTDNYHGEAKFAEYALAKYGVDGVKEFYSRHGLLLASENGRLYPCSFQANALLDTLRFATEKASFLTERRVVEVKRKGDFCVVFTDKEKFFAKYVVLAFGGAAGQNTGMDGKSFEIVKALGHTVTELTPSLVQMKTENEFCKGLKGVKADAKVTLCDGKDLAKVVKTVRGDLLFTDYGVSGNTIFELSAYLEKCKNPYIVAEFLPDEKDEELVSAIKTRKVIYGEKSAETLLLGLINNKLAEKIMRCLAPNKKIKELDDECLINAKNAVKRYIGRVLGTCGFDLAQVTHGGVCCGEVDERTFESKKHDGVYLVGELLNVDGDCGGYNLQWAFSSACCAADDITRKVNGK